MLGGSYWKRSGRNEGLVAQAEGEVRARWVKSARSRSAPTRWPKN